MCVYDIVGYTFKFKIPAGAVCPAGKILSASRYLSCRGLVVGVVSSRVGGRRGVAAAEPARPATPLFTIPCFFRRSFAVVVGTLRIRRVLTFALIAVAINPTRDKCAVVKFERISSPAANEHSSDATRNRASVFSVRERRALSRGRPFSPLAAVLTLRSVRSFVRNLQPHAVADRRAARVGRRSNRDTERPVRWFSLRTLSRGRPFSPPAAVFTFRSVRNLQPLVTADRRAARAGRRSNRDTERPVRWFSLRAQRRAAGCRSLHRFVRFRRCRQQRAFLSRIRSRPTPDTRYCYVVVPCVTPFATAIVVRRTPARAFRTAAASHRGSAPPPPRTASFIDQLPSQPRPGFRRLSGAKINILKNECMVAVIFPEEETEELSKININSIKIENH
ncbi:Hypothetical protein CINCED_3A004469 [Cinara cedri]|uniref:Uncharacterized protein n=1 Tax=Cinara cedri TaxID=506608 RepID=A0A5E4MPV9_9HEMI|nr:Hypothetical protein CINCED_3A004469 [Cinara cedri]